MTIMLKKTLLATAITLACSSAFAGNEYFVVVPVPGKTGLYSAVNVSLASATLPAGSPGVPYAGADLKSLLTVTGDPGYTGYGVHWDIVSGSLPAGLTLNQDGTITGTPTASGTATFQARATYLTMTGAAAYQIVVGSLAISLAAGNPPQALVGQGYSYDLKPLLTVADGSYNGTGVTWSVVSSTLPAGLYLTNDGFIAGTPTASGTGSITARATYKGANGEQTYQVVSSQVTVDLATATPTEATLGQAYSYDLTPLLTVSGDSGFSGSGVTWDISSGSLPKGLSLSSAGVISGTPTVAGTSSVTARATYKNAQGQQTYQLVVLDIKVTLAADTPPDATVGKTYSYDLKSLLTVTGDPNFKSTDVTWALNAGTLPTGLSLTNDGLISGTPSVTNGTGANVTVSASYKSKTGQQVYTIVVSGQSIEVTQLVAGERHTCGLTPAGGVKCWGYNNYGQLGDNTQINRLLPVDVVGLTSGVKSIASGLNHTCALTTAGGVKCWGYNPFGGLGTNDWVNHLAPTDVYGLSSGVASITAGNGHSCALTTAGGAKCWGYNTSGELGNGKTVNVATPVDVSGLTSGVAVLAAGNLHTCAVTAAGVAKCWGYNSNGQVGDGTTTNRSVPTDVVGLGAVTSIKAGIYHTCALTPAGGVKCWGHGTYGELGIGLVSGSNTPVDVTGLTSGVSSIYSAGGVHTCALTTAGGAMCWGYNSNGQIGNGATKDAYYPVAVKGLTAGVTTMATGYYHTCAATSAGTVKCWGDNSKGQLGNGTGSSSSVPVTTLSGS